MRAIASHVRANLIAYLALFLALTGGTAYALDGSNTVFSDDIVNGQVKTADIANAGVGAGDLAGNSVGSGKIVDGSVHIADLSGNAVNSPKVLDGSLTGSDINESSLGQVPDSTELDGESLSQVENVGRNGFGGSCNPDTSAVVTCASTQLLTPAGSSVLVVADGSWYGVDDTSDTVDDDAADAGSCSLAQSGLNNTDISFGGTVRVGQLENDHKFPSQASGFALTGIVSTALDNPTFKVRCNQTNADIRFQDVQISAVRLSSP